MNEYKNLQKLKKEKLSKIRSWYPSVIQIDNLRILIYKCTEFPDSFFNQ